MKVSVYLMVLNLIFLTLAPSLSIAQDLNKERIRKLLSSKASIYLERGIFHNGPIKNEAKLVSIRRSFAQKQGVERVVFDFAGPVPKIYGHFNSQDKRLYIDFFNTNISNEIKPSVDARFVEKINFFPIDKEVLSTELILKGKVGLDIFYLENPGRLVVDLKNI